jgi:AAHS family 4-hydroxybenzoate transporter-like MFS transporter
LTLRHGNTPRVHRWLRQIDPSVELTADTQFVTKEAAKAGSPMAQLFREGRTGVTLLLWAINFMNLINLYFLSNWLPTIVSAAGYSQSTAVLAGTALQVGGTIGTLTMGRIIDQGCSTLTGTVSESGLQHQRSEVEGLLRKRIPESAFV